MSRPAAVSGTFYPGSREGCRRAIEETLASLPDPESLPGEVVGGLVPHAGWVYSGATSALTIRAVADPPPRTVVLFGAVHQPGVTRATLAPEESWETPLGPVSLDGDLRERLRAAAPDLLAEGRAPHRREHSIEVQVPWVAHLCPGARILPVVVPPVPEAVAVGHAVGEVLRESPDRVVVLGSTDLTHYGPRFYGFSPAGTGEEAHRWAKDVNDRAFLDRVLELDPRGALREATEKHSACGPGAAAAALAAARSLGARQARLLAHTTSYEVRPDPLGPTDFVGYAAVVFLR